MSATSRTFGLGLKSSVFGSNRQINGGSIQEFDYSNKFNQATISSVSRPLDSRLRNERFKMGHSLQGKERLNENFRSRVDESVSLVHPKLFGLQCSALDEGPNVEGNLKSKQELYLTNYKSNEEINMLPMCTTFGPLARNIPGSTGLRIQENPDSTDQGSINGAFRRPVASKVIKGRNSTMSSRLFSVQNIKKNSKNLSNLNGFYASHISRGRLNTFPDFRLGERHNWVGNQSVAGSLTSVTSAKAQLMNSLENLHHSILTIVPNLPDSVRVEFDNIREGLESINEMSIAPAREDDAASIISRSSKFICSQIPDHTTTKFLDNSQIPLEIGEKILKTFDLNRKNTGNRTKLLPEVVEEGNEEEVNPSFAAASESMSSKEDSALVFKKPKPFSKRKKSLSKSKINTPQVTKYLTSKMEKNTVIRLKQWYPIAFGRDLKFCGIDEDDEIIRTEAMKKRVSNRKIELSNGIICNLIGSPNTIVSVFSEKVTSLLKNGLTNHWRILQKELLKCQTNKSGSEIKESESPNSKFKRKRKSSPLKKIENTTLPHRKDVKKPLRLGNKERKISPAKKFGRVISPSINETVPTVRTRSGRMVKPPASFSIFPRNNKVSSYFNRQALMLESPENSVKKFKNTVPGIFGRKLKSRNRASPRDNIKKRVIGISVKISKAGSAESPVKKSKKIVSPKTSRIAPPKNDSKGEGEKIIGVASTCHSSAEREKRDGGSRESRTKRKREMVADVESTQTKRSRPEKKTKAEVESSEPLTKTSKGNKRSTSSGKGSLRTNHKKSPHSNMKKSSNKMRNININEKSEQIKEKQNKSNWEDNFELLLDDIKIPEIGNISSKPQLSRSQLRIVSMETPPLKYFNNNLRLLRSTTPARSPEWSISQRTESEVKQFQKRRAEAHKKKNTVEVRKNTLKEKEKTHAQNRDLKNVLDWVSEKNVRSPQWSSRVLQYVIPSRKQMEKVEDEDEDEDEEEEVEV